MKIIRLKAGKRCKCSCRQFFNGRKKYWVNINTYKVYSTDCHKENPKLAKGTFKVVFPNRTRMIFQ